MSKQPTRDGENYTPIDAAALAISKTFAYQSYFDSTNLQNAIVTQPPNSVLLYPEEHQTPGYALALHPSSQTPVAITCKAFGVSGNSVAFTLVPGQTITPFGGRQFRSFKWGLPFGWLGGGMASLLVLQNPYEPEGVTSRTEIVFHRARFKIFQPGGITSGAQPNAPFNWPGRFPWINATNLGTVQSGNPGVAPEPTRIVAALRGITTLATPTNIRAVIQGSDEFSLDAGGVPLALTLTNPIMDELTFPAFVGIGTSGNLATQNIAIDLEASAHPLVRVAADSAGVVFIDDSGAAVLNGAFVDIVRYGRL